MADEESRATDEAAGKRESEPGAAGRTDIKGWVLLIALALYVVLLGIGTVAEVFDIGWILKWPIW